MTKKHNITISRFILHQFFYYFCPRTKNKKHESISSDLKRKLTDYTMG